MFKGFQTIGPLVWIFTCGCQPSESPVVLNCNWNTTVDYQGLTIRYDKDTWRTYYLNKQQFFSYYSDADWERHEDAEVIIRLLPASEKNLKMDAEDFVTTYILYTTALAEDSLIVSVTFDKNKVLTPKSFSGANWTVAQTQLLISDKKQEVRKEVTFYVTKSKGIILLIQSAQKYPKIGKWEDKVACLLNNLEV